MFKVLKAGNIWELWTLMFNREEKLAIGRQYLKTKKARGGIGNNQYMKPGASIGSTAEMLAKEHNVSAGSVKLWAKLAEQDDFKKLVLGYLALAKSTIANG